MEKFVSYLKDTRAELVRVTWPTPRHAAFATVLVVVFSLAVSALIGGFDFLFTLFLDALLGA